MRVSSFYVQLFTQKAFSPVEVSLHLKEIAKRGSSHPEVFGCKKGALENFTWNSQENTKIMQNFVRFAGKLRRWSYSFSKVVEKCL